MSANIGEKKYFLKTERSTGLTLLGCSRYYSFEDTSGIPEQWMFFAPRIPELTAAAKPDTFGVIQNSTDAGFEYFSGVEIPGGEMSPNEFSVLKLEPETYAIFGHTDHVSTLGETCGAIWAEELQSKEFTYAGTPWFERYGENFEPTTGSGGLEVWIPIKN